MKLITKMFKKIFITIAGLGLLIIGIILIPLPGPGLLICFAALFILSLEYDWSKKYFDNIKKQITALINKSKS